MDWNAEQFTKDLVQATQAFDRKAVRSLCQSLVSHLQEADQVYPLDQAKKILSALRRKRFFDLMGEVCDVLIASGRNDAVVRRQYAQSLIDRGELSAALDVLDRLVADTANDPGEHAEARGLIGRTHKQFYVNASTPGERVREHLRLAIDAYRAVYTTQPEKFLWHGINAVACACRAERDGVTIKDPVDAAEMARAILSQVDSLRKAGKAYAWDYATALEACVALGQPEEGMPWVARYVAADGADAFELASTHRQLVEVWHLSPDNRPGSLLLPFLRAQLLQKQGGSVDISASELALRPGKDDPKRDRASYEAVFGTDGFRTLEWYDEGRARCRAVGLISDPSKAAKGTGFLMRGGDLLSKLGDEQVLVTNAHVVSDEAEVQQKHRPRPLRSADARATFQAVDPNQILTIKEVIWSSPPWELDATIVRLQGKVDSGVTYPVYDELPALADTERVYIIGHPGGRGLQLSLNDNLVLDHEDPKIHYRAPTEGGSSGSPVFDSHWRLIGLHHAGDSDMPKLRGKPGTYAANEGIWIQAIRKSMAEQPAA